MVTFHQKKAIEAGHEKGGEDGVGIAGGGGEGGVIGRLNNESNLIVNGGNLSVPRGGEGRGMGLQGNGSAVSVGGGGYLSVPGQGQRVELGRGRKSGGGGQLRWSKVPQNEA